MRKIYENRYFVFQDITYAYVINLNELKNEI